MLTNEKPETAFFNGKIVTLDASDMIATAVAIRNGRVVEVGSDEEVKRICSRETSLIDLKGRTMLPGFIDSHTHLGAALLSFRYYVDGRCPPNKSVIDVQERIEQRVKATPKGNWIITNMSIFADAKLAEKRYPTREELDAVAPEHPVVLLSTAHTQILNTCALRSAGIVKETLDPPEGKIERDKTTGEPTGVLRECNKILPLSQFTYDQLKETIRDGASEYWVKQGITMVCSFGDSREFRAYQELLNEGGLPLRIRAMSPDPLNEHGLLMGLVKLGILPGFGNHWLKIGGVKIYTDGAFMGFSAATYDPYLNMSVSDYHGIFRRDPRTLDELVLKAHNSGLQICIHAIGDKAQDLALNAYENALRENPRSHRHRIEHLGNLMTSQDRIRRAKALGIVPVTTIEWLYAYGDFVELYLGPKRKAQSFLLRSMIDAGLTPANCSDCRGAEPFSINPFFSIWCAVTRQTYFGKRLIPNEAISVREALRLYTRNAAYCNFEGELMGSIETGKLADLIVISRDILTIPENEIKDIKVDMTIIDGKIVYQRQ